MRRFLHFAGLLVVLVVVSVLVVGCGSKKGSGSGSSGSSSSSSYGSSAGSAAGPSKSYDNGGSVRGGTYTVGWEQSFGFTDNFDPTGEYLGNAWGIYVNLLLRPLIGYKHLPGAAG